VIPSFDEHGNLPPGIHHATWEQIVSRFGITEHRPRLLLGLRHALDSLAGAGCRGAYLDGSFVTAKDVPGDFDACWEAVDVDPDKLDPELLDFSDRREMQKRRYGGELFPANAIAAPPNTRYLEFFQIDRRSGEAKGIVGIDLGGSR
jgi:hypothetical protein